MGEDTQNAEQRDGEVRANDFNSRIAALGPDIADAFDDLVTRVELGARQYGLLSLADNPRDWDREAYEEIVDLVWYCAFARLKARRAG